MISKGRDPGAAASMRCLGKTSEKKEELLIPTGVLLKAICGSKSLNLIVSPLSKRRWL
jgi:hypothetical protein